MSAKFNKSAVRRFFQLACIELGSDAPAVDLYDRTEELVMLRFPLADDGNEARWYERFERLFTDVLAAA